MKIEINNKYGIGDVVQRYTTIEKYKDRIVCPLCNGKHFADDPYDDSTLECPHCDEDGYIDTNYVTERILGEEIYRIEAIYVNLMGDGSVKYSYSIQSTPELNNRTSIYISSIASEEDLELLQSQ